MENRGVVLQARSSARRRAERLPSKARAALLACAAGLGATGLGVTGLGVTGLGVTLLAAAAALVPAAHAQVLQPHDLQSIQPQGSNQHAAARAGGLQTHLPARALCPAGSTAGLTVCSTLPVSEPSRPDRT